MHGMARYNFPFTFYTYIPNPFPVSDMGTWRTTQFPTVSTNQITVLNHLYALNAVNRVPFKTYFLVKTIVATFLTYRIKTDSSLGLA
jgi:hypothetical protein